jgi:cell wall-associated NlpC family hydrolase
MITGQALADCARTWVGVPFRHQGRTRNGVDCAGLVIGVLRECNALPRDFQDVPAYGRAPQAVLAELVTALTVQADAPAPGVIVLIRWPGERFASHVGLCTGANLVHAYMRARRVVEHGYRGPWVRDTAALRAVPGVALE